MLRLLVKQLKAPSTRILQNKKHIFKNNVDLLPTLHPTSICWYGIRPKQLSYIEEDTLSGKVLNHIRCKPEGADSWTLVNTDHNNNVHAIHQMLLVIAHSTEVNTSDIIKTFSLYITAEHSILKDIISKKALMIDVKGKVEQKLPSMALADLKKFALLMKEFEFKKSTYLIKMVSDIDSECERRALDADYEECLQLFDILLLLHGGRVHRRHQFDVFMSLFEKHIQSATPIDLVHILHYIGLGKKGKLYKEFVVSIVRKLGDHLHELSFIDAGIAATGIFKTSVKLDTDSVFLLKIEEHMNYMFKNYSKLNDLEAYSFVGMIKLIRAARYHSKKFINSVSTFVMVADADVLSPEVIAHILALYSNMYIYHPEVFTKLEQLMLQYLSTPSQLVRLKDLSRVLWCFSHTRHSCDQEFLNVAEKCITNFLLQSGTNTYPEFFAGSLLSMAILGHYPPKLIKEAYEPQKLHALQGYQRSKPLSRLLMLHETIRVNHPELTVDFPAVSKNDLPTRTISDETRFRPALATLMEGAKVINEKLESSVFKLKFPVPHFNYASLVINGSALLNLCTKKSDSTSYNHISEQLILLNEKHCGSQIAVELLDSNTTVLNTLKPIGMVDMKIQLMKQSGWVLKLITEEEINKCECDAQAIAALILDALDKPSL